MLSALVGTFVETFAASRKTWKVFIQRPNDNLIHEGLGEYRASNYPCSVNETAALAEKKNSKQQMMEEEVIMYSVSPEMLRVFFFITAKNNECNVER